MAKKNSKTPQNDHNGPPKPVDENERYSVLVEMRSQQGGSGAFAMQMAGQLSMNGLEVDEEFEPIPMESGGEGAAAGQASYILRVTVKNEEDTEELRKDPNVIGVWLDTPISGFATKGWDMSPEINESDNGSMAPCPTGSCDCAPGTPKGTIADVATYLGVDQIWNRGFRGNGIVVGVLDSGITALGRPVKPGETSRRIGRVIGGWPSGSWGTESSKWGDHGNMCATDVLGMAPEAQLYDLRIAGSGGSPGTISRALQAFQWSINQFRSDGTPQVLTNSWGIFQESWDATYARNPNHPFTRKVEQAIAEGILVLFAAGNCGDTCPDGRCGSDNGPNRSIWGANGHRDVMTVGAVNKNEQFIGYSSRGPAALTAQKPDFCSISHFSGYFNSDSGTSAATPILAGAVALMKQAKPAMSQAQAKSCLQATAKQILGSGWNQNTGHGIVQVLRAFDRCSRPIVTTPSRDIIQTTPARDRITIAIRDRITTPARDQITIAVRDRITTPIRDFRTDPRGDLRTDPRGDIITSAVRDNLTTPWTDNPRTNPSIDFRKSPFLDTRDEHLKPPRFEDPIRPPISPFVLATPHHAQDWEMYDEYPGQEDYDDYGDEFYGDPGEHECGPCSEEQGHEDDPNQLIAELQEQVAYLTQLLQEQG